MKKKIFTALGLMSGTSLDGVDLSLIETDGYDYYVQISDKYYEFNDELYKEIIFLREKIKNSEDLQKIFICKIKFRKNLLFLMLKL